MPMERNRSSPRNAELTLLFSIRSAAACVRHDHCDEENRQHGHFTRSPAFIRPLTPAILMPLNETSLVCDPWNLLHHIRRDPTMPQTSTEPKGCLAAILALFGIHIGGPSDDDSQYPQEGSAEEKELPYRQRDDFLSPAEFSFYRVLAAAIGNRAVICPKVGLGDVFYVARSDNRQSFRNKIDRKHVDFIVCDPQTMKPRLGIELDDASHGRADRAERDHFVDGVFEAAGLPLVHVPARSGYDPKALAAQVAPHLAGPAPVPAVPPPAHSASVPVCSKCGVPMVQRVASKGQNKGRAFWGCPNYPQCKEIG